MNLIAVDRERSGNGPTNLRCQRLDVDDTWLRPPAEPQLVAAEAGDHVRFAHTALEPIGDHFQERVADGMPQRVVDILEMIKVEIKNGKGRIMPRLARANAKSYPVQKRYSIGQAVSESVRASRRIICSAVLRSVISRKNQMRPR